MEGKLRQVLANHRNHTRVVRTRTDLGEDDPVATDEHLHAEDTIPAECTGYLAGDVLRLCQCRFGHSLRLPRLAVVAVHLMVPYRLQEERPACMAHGQKRYLIIETDKPLHNHTPCSCTTALLAHIPRMLNVSLCFDSGLPVSGRGHNRLHHARQTDMLHGCEKLLIVVGKLVPRSRQAEFLGCQTAYRLTVHSQKSGMGSRDNTIALFLKFHQSGRGYRLHLGDDKRRLLLLHHTAECLTVEHVEDMTAMCHLHSGGIGILVARNHFHAVALQFNGYFFPEFATSEQQCPRSNGS